MTRASKASKRAAPRASAWAEQLLYIDEPRLEFANGQLAEHPRDGLYLYGPALKEGSPVAIEYGVIGTKEGLERFAKWAKRVALPIPRFVPAKNPDALHHITFPGFEAAFNAKWLSQPAATIVVDQTKIDAAIRIGNKAEAIKTTVDLYVNPLIAFSNKQETALKMWFVILPEIIFKFGRPTQKVPKAEQTRGVVTVSPQLAKQLRDEPSLFPEDDTQAEIYRYALDFRRQLKARLLQPKIVTQLVRETTIAPNDFLNKIGQPVRSVEDPATLAWKLCTTTYYKAGGSLGGSLTYDQASATWAWSSSRLMNSVMTLTHAARPRCSLHPAMASYSGVH